MIKSARHLVVPHVCVKGCCGHAHFLDRLWEPAFPSVLGSDGAENLLDQRPAVVRVRQDHRPVSAVHVGDEASDETLVATSVLEVVILRNEEPQAGLGGDLRSHQGRRLL